MKALIAVFLGGGLGSAARYGLKLLIDDRVASSGFPWSTFVVNIAGSFLIGLFYALASKFNLPAEAKLFLTIGLCGGFTTFSTFSNESLTLINHGHSATFLLYALLSVGLSILATLAGANIIK